MPDTHVKIPAVQPIIRYVANGTQTIFEYPFPMTARANMRVLMLLMLGKHRVVQLRLIPLLRVMLLLHLSVYCH